jgi:hypothetical protein
LRRYRGSWCPASACGPRSPRGPRVGGSHTVDALVGICGHDERPACQELQRLQVHGVEVLALVQKDGVRVADGRRLGRIPPARLSIRSTVRSPNLISPYLAPSTRSPAESFHEAVQGENVESLVPTHHAGQTPQPAPVGTLDLLFRTSHDNAALRDASARWPWTHPPSAPPGAL